MVSSSRAAKALISDNLLPFSGQSGSFRSDAVSKTDKETCPWHKIYSVKIKTWPLLIENLMLYCTKMTICYNFDTESFPLSATVSWWGSLEVEVVGFTSAKRLSMETGLHCSLGEILRNDEHFRVAIRLRLLSQQPDVLHLKCHNYYSW